MARAVDIGENDVSFFSASALIFVDPFFFLFLFFCVHMIFVCFLNVVV